MKKSQLPILILFLLQFTSCVKKPLELPGYYYIVDGEVEFEASQGLLNMYDKTGDRYDYVLICSNGDRMHSGWKIEDNFCNNDFVKIHFRGDSITELEGSYDLVPDSNTYIVYDYNDSLGTFSSKKYIKSGQVTIDFKLEANGFPRLISFTGSSEQDENISFFCFISEMTTSYKFQRELAGSFTYQGKKYDISSQNMIEDSSKFDFKVGDIDIDQSLRNRLYISVFKDYISGSTCELSESNRSCSYTRLYGTLGIYDLEENMIQSGYFREGSFSRELISDKEIKYNFLFITAEKDSISGYWLDSNPE